MFLKSKILVNLLWTPLKFIKLFLTTSFGMPTDVATAIAAVVFLILCIPIIGTFIFLINLGFVPIILIFKSNIENSFFLIIFMIWKLEFLSNPYVFRLTFLMISL